MVSDVPPLGLAFHHLSYCYCSLSMMFNIEICEGDLRVSCIDACKQVYLRLFVVFYRAIEVAYDT